MEECVKGIAHVTVASRPQSKKPSTTPLTAAPTASPRDRNWPFSSLCRFFAWFCSAGMDWRLLQSNRSWTALIQRLPNGDGGYTAAPW